MADKFLNYTQLQAFLNKLKEKFATKDVVTTSANGLMAASDKTKLNGIAAGAEVNVQSDWNATSGDAYIANKPTIPTESTVSGWGFTKNTGTVTSVAVKMNGSTKGTVTGSGTIDLGTVITAHQDISGKANVASPTFTGTPAAPTASAGTNTTQIATTAFVNTAINNAIANAIGGSY